MDNMSDFYQLNQYICWYIQNDGISYVVDNYVDLRERYYSEKSNVGFIG